MTDAAIERLCDELTDTQFTGALQHLRNWTGIERLHRESAATIRSQAERVKALEVALAKERRLDAVTGRVVEAAIEEAEGHGTQNDTLAAAVEAYQRATGAWDEAQGTLNPTGEP